MRDDHSDVDRDGTSGIVKRDLDRARSPSPSGRTSRRPCASVTQPEPRNLAEDSWRPLRALRPSARSSTTAAAPSPKTVPRRSRSNGRTACGREQAEAVVVENSLRLDRRIVADGHGAVRLAAAHGRRRFDDRQRPANALVGDAGVGALEAVPDADVAKHVVRQIRAATSG